MTRHVDALRERQVKNLKNTIISLFITVLAASTSQAGLVQTFGVGANATAQGEAVTAHADDPFAVYYNPAGLTLITQKVVTSGAIVYDAKVKVTDFSITSSHVAAAGADFNPGPADFESNGDRVLNPNLGFAMPINDKLSFGIAAYAPYGFHLKWDSDFTRNPGALYAWESKYVRETVTPGMGYKISDRLAVGFSVSLGRSISDAAKTYPANPADGTPVTKLKLESEDSFNYSFNAGVMYRPTDAIYFGLTYRSRAEGDFKGDVIINGTKVSTVTMDYDHPESIQAGARYFVTSGLSVEFDLTWTRWGIHDEQIEKSPIAPGGEFRHNRKWSDEIQYKIGAQWQATECLTLRSGYTYDPTPVPSETFDFGWPDTDRNVFNLGFGWAINEHWTLDGVIQHVRSPSVRNINGNSDELNHVYGGLVSAGSGGAIPADTVSVSMGNEGILWGYGINLSYSF